jgi:hypothetical protein
MAQSLRDEVATLVVRTADDLRAMPALLVTDRALELQLDLPMLNQAEALQLSARLSRQLRECGCSMGAITASACLALMLGWLLLDPPQGLMSIALRLLAALVFIVLGSGLAKLVSSTWARRHALREIERLQQALNQFTALHIQQQVV